MDIGAVARATLGAPAPMLAPLVGPMVQDIPLAEGTPEWLGIFLMGAWVVLWFLDRTGRLPRAEGSDRRASDAPLASSIDSLGGKVDTLGERIDKLGSKVDRNTNRLDAQTAAAGAFADEVKKATEQAASTHQFIQLQRAIDEERRKGGA